MDEDDEIPDIREQIFHNTVREQIVSSTQCLRPHSIHLLVGFYLILCARLSIHKNESEYFTNQPHTKEKKIT